MRIFALGMALAAATLTASCGGKSPAVHDALAKAGLLGHWADDCSQPAGPLDFHATFSAPAAGAGQLEFNFGDESNATIYSIQSAQQTGGGKTRLEAIDRSDGTKDEIVILQSANRFQIYSNVQSDGHVFIKDGIMVPSGTPVNWMTRCE